MRLHSFVSRGFNGDFITVEADLRKGFPGFDVVGLPDSAIRESRERVRSALRKTGYPIPRKRVLINRAPAGIQKAGSQIDLAMALVIIFAQRVAEGLTVPIHHLPIMVIGELALDGSVIQVQNAQGAIETARNHGCLCSIVPHQSDMFLSDDISLVSSLPEAVEYVDKFIERFHDRLKFIEHPMRPQSNNQPSFSHIFGLQGVRKALMVAAAGGHHVLLFGPPGVGKTLCATAFPSILPPLDDKQIGEISRIQSVIGIGGDPVLCERPRILIPQTCSRESFPVEAAKSHGGVMIIDEISHLTKGVLEQLREVYDKRKVWVRADRKISEFPASFQMIATMQACPCGELGIIDGRCSCSQNSLLRYWRALSPGLLDRFDIRFPVDPSAELPIARMKFSMEAALQRQLNRYAHTHGIIRQNADILHVVSQREQFIDRSILESIQKHAQNRLSVRGELSVFSLARTLADLTDNDSIDEKLIDVALDLRKFGLYDFYWRSY